MKRILKYLLILCVMVSLVGCGSSSVNEVVFFEWGISYTELKEQLQQKYESVTCVDENFGASTEIENYNGDKGIKAGIGYLCNKDTQKFEQITMLLNTENSSEYGIDEYFQKWIVDTKNSYGEPVSESGFMCEWSADDMDITIMPSGESLFVIYKAK